MFWWSVLEGFLANIFSVAGVALFVAIIAVIKYFWELHRREKEKKLRNEIKANKKEETK